MDTIQKTVDALTANNIECILVQTKQEALAKTLEMIPEGSTVGLGGSVTVEQVGLLERLRSGKYTLYDQYEAGIDMPENMKRRKQGLTAQFFVAGTNAITSDGQLVNVDGLGNRVAAQAFGPEKVILIAGTNKIVKDVHDAFDRLQNVAAPTNAKRVNYMTPCQETGVCIDCDSPMRICNIYTIIRRMMFPGRLTVILVNESLGY
ncbi:MAG: lactate utilization protein [Candidatus Abyssobacteria bacterium SURF_5]|uniref:Lactate utilization protein n=1 Tax=Abyssobacteria bacterium (strain SURF_5) TaxID=2093360 RepID=A0A3A4NTF0_ABYX5|nr:MAG: lactate utilization protein [Candidatus Abyssubacteria bacterium SURF_5]